MFVKYYTIFLFGLFAYHQSFAFTNFGLGNVVKKICLKKFSLQMAKIEVAMPALSSTMKEGKIVAWNKKVGDKVAVGDILMVVESDKADMDVEAFEEGYLAKIITPEGGVQTVGSAVAFLASTKEEIASISSGNVQAEPAAPVVANTAQQSSVATTNIDMPALSSTMKEGKIVAWNKKVGDKVNVGDVLLVVESDKADMDVEAFEEGYLAKIITPEGGVAPVGAPVALLVANKDDVSKAASIPSSLSSAAPAQAPAQAPAPAPAPAPASNAAHTPAVGVINATPSAKKYAAENNIDITKIKGTGNFGRVTGDDVLIAAGKKTVAAAKPASTPAASTTATATAAAAAKPVSSPAAPTKPGTGIDGVVAMTGMQKAVAKNMEKTMNVPIFRVSREITTDDFDALYAQLKSKGVTVSSLLAKAVAETLKKHPVVNAAYVEGGIQYNKDINVAMAVAIDGGLITPTIIKAQDQDLFSMSRVWKELVEKAKSGKLSPAEYSSGTFYISNLGMFGVQQFDAILPSGAGSILSIAASTPKVIQDKSGNLKVKKSMIVTITCDHRHIYGADAAEFLKDLAELIESNSSSLTMG